MMYVTVLSFEEVKLTLLHAASFAQAHKVRKVETTLKEEMLDTEVMESHSYEKKMFWVNTRNK